MLFACAQVCMTAQAQMFPKREAVQLLKDRLQAWCAEENRRELEGIRLPGGASTGAAAGQGSNHMAERVQ